MSLNVSYMQIKQWKCLNLIRIADTGKKTNIGLITFDYLYCEKRLGATVIFSFIKLLITMRSYVVINTLTDELATYKKMICSSNYKKKNIFKTNLYLQSIRLKKQNVKKIFLISKSLKINFECSVMIYPEKKSH